MDAVIQANLGTGSESHPYLETTACGGVASHPLSQSELSIRVVSQSVVVLLYWSCLMRLM